MCVCVFGEVKICGADTYVLYICDRSWLVLKNDGSC